jgi:polyisoprenyl-phosphate glycosyltransferase
MVTTFLPVTPPSELTGTAATGGPDIGKCPRFSFVIPALDEILNVEPMTRRLVSVGEQLGEPFEIIWVDDGSTDGTAAKLEELAESDERIRPLYLSRNFGHMAALTAGLDHARASGAVVTLDADGQHPPELIPQLVQLWREGSDIVQTVRVATSGESTAKKLTSRFFYRLLNRLGEIDLPDGAADFRLLDRQAVDALKSLPERVRFLRGLVQWVGFTKSMVPYEAPPRLAGDTKYGFGKMLLLALSAITSFSVRPLRIAFLTGVIVLLLAACYALYVLIAYAVGKPLVQGWASQLLVTLFLGGVQLLTLGVASEYLGRVYDEAKRRPVYIVRKPRRSASSTQADVRLTSV